MKKEMTITTYPCYENTSLRAECEENSKHVKINDYRPHSCGAKFQKVVIVDEVGFTPAKRYSAEDIQALKLAKNWAMVEKAKRINRHTFKAHKLGREGTGERKWKFYYQNIQGSGNRAFQIERPQLPATV